MSEGSNMSVEKEFIHPQVKTVTNKIINEINDKITESRNPSYNALKLNEIHPNERYSENAYYNQSYAEALYRARRTVEYSVENKTLPKDCNAGERYARGPADKQTISVLKTINNEIDQTIKAWYLKPSTNNILSNLKQAYIHGLKDAKNVIKKVTDELID